MPRVPRHVVLQAEGTRGARARLDKGERVPQLATHGDWTVDRMNRRNFLGLLGATPVIATAPALLELLAPTRTIFLPPHGGWISGDLRFKAIERHSYGWNDPRAFSHESLEQMLIALKRKADTAGVPISIHPTRLIVHPSWTREQVEERLKWL
jgi:hypothetical protein